MAILTSEDETIKSFVEIKLLHDSLKNKSEFSWIPYSLKLLSADVNLQYESPAKNKGAGDYVFALKPINELEELLKGLKNFLLNPELKNYFFEPVEPSFEITFERSYRGFSVYFWIDAGNVISDHYSWDGFGLRFFTSEEKIKSFTKELSKEMEMLFSKNA